MIVTINGHDYSSHVLQDGIKWSPRPIARNVQVMSGKTYSILTAMKNDISISFGRLTLAEAQDLLADITAGRVQISVTDPAVSTGSSTKYYFDAKIALTETYILGDTVYYAPSTLTAKEV